MRIFFRQELDKIHGFDSDYVIYHSSTATRSQYHSDRIKQVLKDVGIQIRGDNNYLKISKEERDLLALTIENIDLNEYDLYSLDDCVLSCHKVEK